MEAQTKAATAIGEYYLTGAMETACGFKLNQDSTFQFFFSYGALDRFGEGSWSIKNNTIVFNSKPKTVQDFQLLNASGGKKEVITIQVKEINEMLSNHVYCKIKGGGKEQEGMTENGTIQFQPQLIETIELILEFCPEKKSVFTVASTGQHAFEFKPMPWLMEVQFQNFALSFTEEGLRGGHPLSEEKTFFYEKNK